LEFSQKKKKKHCSLHCNCSRWRLQNLLKPYIHHEGVIGNSCNSNGLNVHILNLNINCLVLKDLK
jgi:hypothetical protein